jgi:ribonuclease D
MSRSATISERGCPSRSGQNAEECIELSSGARWSTKVLRFGCGLAASCLCDKYFRVIDTEEKLAAWLPKLRAAKWVAVDTEADSLHAYPEKVCLIQISTADGDRLIDPLARIKLDPLLEALNAHELIMHGADYDLRLLRKHHEFTPSAIFDTMLAARLLGERQFGLSSLAEKFLGVKMDKGSQKADWARRPLTEKMEIYARNDTHYLQLLADKLKLELQRKDRLAWHQESCARLIADCSRPSVVDGDSVWRIKGSSHLGRPALAVLRELWHWREREAIVANRPPFFILNHEKLSDVASAAVENQPVENLLSPRMSPRRRDALLEAVQSGLAVPAGRQPEIIRHKFDRPNEAERRRYADLASRRDAHAHKLGIDATLIASKATLGDLARDWSRHAPELMSWQRELLK